MSALQAPVTPRGEKRSEAPPASRLQAVQPPTARLSRAPFLLVLIGVFGLGMAGLLMLNTTLQNQAFSSRALSRQATELTYAQATLENQIAVAAAPPELARRASALGMRANPYPVLLEMPSGRVIGEPQAVSGAELPSLIVRTPAEIAAAKAAAQARAEARAAAVKAKIAADKKAAEQKAIADKKAAEKKAADKKRADQKAADRKAADQKKAAEQDRTGAEAEQG